MRRDLNYDCGCESKQRVPFRMAHSGPSSVCQFISDSTETFSLTLDTPFEPNSSTYSGVFFNEAQTLRANITVQSAIIFDNQAHSVPVHVIVSNSTRKLFELQLNVMVTTYVDLNSGSPSSANATFVFCGRTYEARTFTDSLNVNFKAIVQPLRTMVVPSTQPAKRYSRARQTSTLRKLSQLSAVSLLSMYALKAPTVHTTRHSSPNTFNGSPYATQYTLPTNTFNLQRGFAGHMAVPTNGVLILLFLLLLSLLL